MIVVLNEGARHVMNAVADKRLVLERRRGRDK